MFCSVSLNDGNVMKVSSNIEDHFSKDDDILVSKSRPSSIASQFPSKPSQGNLFLRFIFN